MSAVDGEQRKAYKQYLKSTRGHEPDPSSWTAFRAAEKRFKAKYPPPSLDAVLDLKALVASDDQLEALYDHRRGSRDAIATSEIRLSGKHNVDRRAFTIPAVPGLVLLPSYLSVEEQRKLIFFALSDYTRFNETNLHAHYNLPDGLWQQHASKSNALIYPNAQLVSPSTRYAQEEPGPRKLVNNKPGELAVLHSHTLGKLPPPPSTQAQPATASELVLRLRWANLGYLYHWGSKSYDFSKPTYPVPELIRLLSEQVVQEIDWSDVWSDSHAWIDGEAEWQSWGSQFSPDAGITNFYRLNSTLMGHVDRSEVSATSPLVSMSLGRPAIFLIGGESRDVEPVPILLRSGDVIVMSGPCRRAYHGVPRILEDSPTPGYLVEDNLETEGSWKAIGDYIQDARININVRQVFPSGTPSPMASIRLEHRLGNVKASE